VHILTVTDAWEPQVNGVVRTIQATNRVLEDWGHQTSLITPLDFKTVPCPTYPEIRLALFPGAYIRDRILKTRPDAIHIATEGPLGWAARAFCRRTGIPFVTAYHTRFPEYVHARSRVPLGLTYGLFRYFHNAAATVLAPTPAIIRDLEARGFRQVRFWSRGVNHAIFKPSEPRPVEDKKPPVFLFVGRVAVEKNIQAFLDLDLPGEKWVAGEGPSLEGLRRRYPTVRFFGVMTQTELASLYSAADVFVFPSRTDTFGLVMVEAMACGLPVAAYPVEGPIDVIGSSDAGVLSEDLRAACLEALKIPKARALARASEFGWERATQEFLDAHKAHAIDWARLRP
jgi:glycosyltransferase involved in cell wall biosynthesis